MVSAYDNGPDNEQPPAGAAGEDSLGEAPQRTEHRSEPPAPELRRRSRSWGIAGLLALALTAGAVGGAIGNLSAARGEPPPAPAPVAVAQPVRAESAETSRDAPPANVAASVFRQAGPAVVEVVVAGQSRSGSNQSGNGSGVVVDSRGSIITNYHVVADARTITVRFASGERREAEVVGTDRGNDLALLKVDLPPAVPVASLADSDAVGVGDPVVVIGAPFGLAQSVTQGIVSAVHREWRSGNGPAQRDLIQTDAAINPGNSGGPLLNAAGQVIGITSMIESPVRGSVGIGFAIPSNTAKRLLPKLETGAKLEPGWLGIAGQDLTEALAGDLGLPARKGVVVSGVVEGSPASRVGLQGQAPGAEGQPDVIIALDGEAVEGIEQLAARIAAHQPGDSVELTLLRDRQERKITVTLGRWPRT